MQAPDRLFTHAQEYDDLFNCQQIATNSGILEPFIEAQMPQSNQGSEV